MEKSLALTLEFYLTLTHRKVLERRSEGSQYRSRAKDND